MPLSERVLILFALWAQLFQYFKKLVYSFCYSVVNTAFNEKGLISPSNCPKLMTAAIWFRILVELSYVNHINVI